MRVVYNNKEFSKALEKSRKNEVIIFDELETGREGEGMSATAMRVYKYFEEMKGERKWTKQKLKRLMN